MSENTPTDKSIIQSFKGMIADQTHLALALEVLQFVGAWDWDVVRDQVTANAEFAKLYSVDPQIAAQGAPIAEFFKGIHPDDLPLVQQKVQTCLQHGGDFVMDYRLLLPSGNIRWVFTKGQCYLDADGHAVRFPGVAIDITERKQAATNLKTVTDTAERQRIIYETALSNTPDLVYIFDMDACFTYANKALLEMWGCSWEEAAGKGLRELGYPEWHARMHEQEIAEVIETKKPIRGEVPFTGAHGRRIYEYIFSPVFDVDGNVIRIAGTTRDVTERKKMEDALRASEQRARAIINTALDAVIIMDMNGSIIEWNHQAENIFGWTYAEAIGKPLVDLIIPRDLRKAHQTGLQHYMLTGEANILNKRIEITALNKANEIFPVELAVTPQKNNDEIFFTAFIRDITAQKNANSALQESRSHLSLMVESAQDFAIISMDLAGQIISWNSGAERIFGYLSEEAIGAPIEIIFTPEDRAAGAAAKELATAFQDGRAEDERWHIRKNNERFYVSGIMTAMYDEDGAVKGFTKIARDMTDQKYAEQQLIEARNAAEAANLAKSEFLANMSHEIRTPMNAIIGLSNILSLSQPLTQKQNEYIKTLQMSADSLLGLINDLLDIAKIEARTVELEQMPFSITQIIQEVASMMAMRVHEKGLNFSGAGECIEQRSFIGDPTRLRQIVLNLCSNAVKFTETGNVHVGITCHATDNPEIENICISVKDSGIGIAPEKLASIFEKFVQADTSINRKYGGTGLGLAITKTLVEIMGGTIHVESELGQGSNFTVCIPLKLADADTVVTANHSLPATLEHSLNVQLRPRILLVEDYAANVLVARTFLEGFGYEVDVASNGIEALDKAKAGNYLAILMDVQMHGMNGFEATQLIREYEKQNGKDPMPIIGMTAHALAGDRERCLSAGMDDYIAKPFNPSELEEKLRDLADMIA